MDCNSSDSESVAAVVERGFEIEVDCVPFDLETVVAMANGLIIPTEPDWLPEVLEVMPRTVDEAGVPEESECSLLDLEAITPIDDGVFL